jgi:hypothetical protein
MNGTLAGFGQIVAKTAAEAGVEARGFRPEDL